MKLTVEYNPTAGYVFRDGKAQEWVDNVIHRNMNKPEDREGWVIIVGSSLLIDCFRLRIAQGVIKPEQIQFKYNNEIIKVNKYGTLEKWPKGFCDETNNILIEILTLGCKARKEKKNNGKSPSSQ